MREIAKAAGMLPGSLHYRYPTKDALLLDLMRRGMDADLAGVRSAIGASRDPVERLRLALRARLGYLLSRDAAQVILYDWRALKGKRARGDDPPARPLRGLLVRPRLRSGRRRPAAARPRPEDAAAAAVRRHELRGPVVLAAGRSARRTEIADAFWEFLAFGVLDDAHRPRRREAARSRSSPRSWPRGASAIKRARDRPVPATRGNDRPLEADPHA